MRSFLLSTNRKITVFVEILLIKGNNEEICAFNISDDIFNESNDFMNNITQDDLLQFLYKEGTTEKTYQIQKLLAEDSNLQERFEQLKTAKGRLDKIKLISPDSRSVDNIFNYSQRAIEEMHVHSLS
jgi:hypothetical protein